jgi:hypothetical protein
MLLMANHNWSVAVEVRTMTALGIYLRQTYHERYSHFDTTFEENRRRGRAKVLYLAPHV